VSDTNNRLKEIIDAYIERNGDAQVDSGIVSSHIAQMKLFGIRQGVEFFPSQDNFGQQRGDFIKKVIKYNKLDIRLDSIWDYFLCDGKGLFYIRPTENNYRLYYFRNYEYRSYYNVDGELEEVVIIYSYKVKQNAGNAISDIGLGGIEMGQLTGGNVAPKETPGRKKYIRLSIKPLEIEETHSDGEMSFENITTTIPGKSNKFPNELGYIPCVEIFNNPKGFSMEGNGEFDQFASQICLHDELVRTMRKNLQFFGNPTLLSSRPKTDLIESSSGDGAAQRPSIAANSGFTSMSPLSSSTFKQDPIGRSSVDGSIRVPRVIANLEPNDRVGYIVPDAISGDQNAFVRQFREEIRTALGGVDELSISAGVTATEYKSLFGRVAATSKKKANSVYEHGICRCLELIIFMEETMFKDTLAAVAGIEKPVTPATDSSLEEKAAYQQALKQFEIQMKQIMQALIKAQMVPPGVKGLIPDGDLTVNWRWLGPVYEESTQDILNNSIVVRNLQELGVDSIEALKYLFPAKTDEERAEMLSGFPFRMVGELQGAYNKFSGLVAGMMQTPHPQAPDLPLAADPRLDLTPYLYRTLEALQKEMSYAGRYRPIDPTDEPTIRGPKQLRGSSPAAVNPSSGEPGRGSLPPGGTPGGTSGSPQLPIRPVSIRPPFPTGSPTGEPMGIGVQPGGGSSGPTSLPIPGSTITGPGSGSESVYPGELGVTGSGQLPSELRTIGSADLATKPDILAQLFPNLLGQLLGGRGPGAGLESGKPDGGGELRNRGSGNSKSVRPKPGRDAGQRRGMGPNRN
jgi:hypothetical protein